MNYRSGKSLGVHSNRSGKYLKRPETALKMNELPLGQVIRGSLNWCGKFLENTVENSLKVIGGSLGEVPLLENLRYSVY